MLKEKGGSEWWVSGGAVDVINGKWEQPWVTLGDRNSKAQNYIIKAVVTDKQYSSGDKLMTLEKFLAEDTISISITRL